MVSPRKIHYNQHRWKVCAWIFSPPSGKKKHLNNNRSYLMKHTHTHTHIRCYKPNSTKNGIHFYIMNNYNVLQTISTPFRTKKNCLRFIFHQKLCLLYVNSMITTNNERLFSQLKINIRFSDFQLVDSKNKIHIH